MIVCVCVSVCLFSCARTLRLVTLFCSFSFCSSLNFAMLCYAMLCYAMLCYAMLCCCFSDCVPLFMSSILRKFLVLLLWLLHYDAWRKDFLPIRGESKEPKQEEDRNQESGSRNQAEGRLGFILCCLETFGKLSLLFCFSGLFTPFLRICFGQTCFFSLLFFLFLFLSLPSYLSVSSFPPLCLLLASSSCQGHSDAWIAGMARRVSLAHRHTSHDRRPAESKFGRLGRGRRDAVYPEFCEIPASSQHSVPLDPE